MRVQKLTKIKKFLSTRVRMINLLISSVVILGLTWSIVRATEDELTNATSNFSVIGTISSITDGAVSLVDSRGSDTRNETLYNLNIEYLDKVETNNYEPLSISNLSIGDTIIAQGITDGNTFFIKRIISFDTTPLPIQEETAYTQEEDISSTTLEIIDESMENSSSSTQNIFEVEETIEEIDMQDNTTIPTSSSTIETISDIISEGLEQASNVLDIIVDTVVSDEQLDSTDNSVQPSI